MYAAFRRIHPSLQRLYSILEGTHICLGSEAGIRIDGTADIIVRRTMLALRQCLSTALTVSAHGIGIGGFTATGVTAAVAPCGDLIGQGFTAGYRTFGCAVNTITCKQTGTGHRLSACLCTETHGRKAQAACRFKCAHAVLVCKIHALSYHALGGAAHITGSNGLPAGVISQNTGNKRCCLFYHLKAGKNNDQLCQQIGYRIVKEDQF